MVISRHRKADIFKRLTPYPYSYTALHILAGRLPHFDKVSQGLFESSTSDIWTGVMIGDVSSVEANYDPIVPCQWFIRFVALADNYRNALSQKPVELLGNSRWVRRTPACFETASVRCGYEIVHCDPWQMAAVRIGLCFRAEELVGIEL